MKYLIIATALLLGGCMDYKCVDGHVYFRINDDTWTLSNQHPNPCVKGDSK